MKKNFIYTLASVALVLAGCVKNEIENPQPSVVTVIEVSAPESKAVIAEDGVTVNWQVGDQIKVNNVNSRGLTADDITGEGAYAKFTFDGELNIPYYGMYNATNGYQFSTEGEDPHCLVNLDSPQTYVEGSFDAAVATYWGTSSTLAIPFQHAMAYIKVTPTVEGSKAGAKIAYIMLSSRSGAETLSGRFQLSFVDGHMAPVDGHANNRTFVVMNGPAEGVELGKSFIISIPVQNYAGGLCVRIVDTEGNYMERNLKTFTAEAGHLYNVSTPFKPKDPVVATACEVSSSTACFTWTLGKDVEADITKAWTIQCSKNEDFTDATEYTIPTDSGSSVWDNKTPKFCFGGLAQATTYYFRVKSGEGAWCEVVSATTETYDKTVVSANANVGDVILAEDFAASAVSAEIVAKAAGVTDGVFKKYTDSFTVANDSKTSIPEDLKNWGFARGAGSANLYANQGHIKLGTGSAQSYLVSPELTAIPSNKMATLEVTLTLAVYPHTSDLANVTKFIVSSETGSMSTKNLFTCDAASNKVMASLAPTEEERAKWNTYTVTLPNVKKGDRLMIAAANNAGYNRLLINDVKVKITALGDIPDFMAQATEVSSSTVSFTWGYNGETAAENANHPYEVYLYKDEACTDLVVSHRFTAGNACWKSRKPKFCFGGLDPETTYYFKVKDTNATVESDVVSAITTPFTIVTMPTSAAAGDVILAEDFSEVILGGEPVIASAAACVENNQASVFIPVVGPFPSCVYTVDTDEQTLTDATALSGKRLEQWSYAFNSGSNIYAHVGCVKLGTKSNNTWLTTPVLSAIPSGKKAELEITVTLSGYSEAVQTGFVYAGNIADKASITTATNVKKSSTLSTAVGTWKTFTVTLSDVDKTMRIAIGPDNDTDKTAKGKGRMVVNDVVVKIKSLK